MFFSWIWTWCALAVSLMALLPAFFGKRHRLGYAAFLSTIAALFLSAAWVRNLNAREELYLQFSSNTPTHVEEFVGSIQCDNGALSVGFADHHDESEESVRSQDGKTRCRWYRIPHKGYPEVRDPAFDFAGFKMKWLSEPDRPGRASTRHFWLLMCPAWFPLPFLSILPVLYIRRLLHRRKVRQRRESGCCLACGYDLRAHRPGDKCPECATPVVAASTVPPTGARTAPPAQTPSL